jgi:hypothetical protein
VKAKSKESGRRVKRDRNERERRVKEGGERRGEEE